ncbi:MAG: extracellular solute-binding protein [Patescibacteria group bacterium]
MSTFKIAVIGIFIFFGVIGVFLFASYGSSDKATVPEVTIWGTLPGRTVADYLHEINSKSTVLNATYVEILPSDFKETFVNALAEGRGPDLVLLPDDLLYQERNKLVPIGYQTYPERDFRDTYIDAAELFLSKTGILGVPFAIDPLVMYWNQDIFSTAGIARPPQYWTELSGLAPRIIERNDTSNIMRAMVPFGEFRNVSNAKEILATLFFQAGSDIVVEGDSGEFYSTLDVSPGSSVTAPTNSAVNFYAGFSNPVNPLYTWNRSLPLSRETFLAGDLAMYFGFASELRELQSKNPNLNFDVATMPQAEGAPKSSYGRIYALSIVKGSRNLSSALTAIGIMTSAQSLQTWSIFSQLPPVRRDLLTTRPKDAYLDIFYNAAIQAKTWMDPDPDATNEIFRSMVESVTTGRAETGNDVVTLAKQRLDQALKENR